MQPGASVWAWWKVHSELGPWRLVTSILVLLQPSSAASERVFSIFTKIFDKDTLVG